MSSILRPTPVRNATRGVGRLPGLAFCLAVGAIAGTGPYLRAQSYQSSFSEVTFDKAQTPYMNHGGVNIDVATGAASLTVPLGPGIGARGAVYRPTLTRHFQSITRTSFSMEDPLLASWGRFLVDWRTVLDNKGGIVKTNVIINDKTTTPEKPLIPGYFSLEIPYRGFLGNRQGSRFEINGVGATIIADSTASEYNASNVLSKFSEYSQKTVGNAPYYEGDIPSKYAKLAGANMLIYAIAESGETGISTAYSIHKSGQIEYKIVKVPNTIVIVAGEIIYEMQYAHKGKTFVGSMVPVGGLDQDGPKPFRGNPRVRYHLVKISNTSGDKITFDYPAEQPLMAEADFDPDRDSSEIVPPLPYTATWSRNGTNVGHITVTKEGLSEDSDIKIAYSESQPAIEYRITSKGIRNVYTDEWISFSEVSIRTDPVTIKFGKLDNPYREIVLEFEEYQFLDVDSDKLSPSLCKTMATGVKSVTEKSYSVKGYEDRKTSYARKVPKPVLVTDGTTGVAGVIHVKPIRFDSTEFTTTVTNPDGSSVRYEFERPMEVWDPWIPSTDPLKLSRFSKNVTLSESYSDTLNSEYRTIKYSNFKLETLNNPVGVLARGSVQYPTTTEDTVDGRTTKVEKRDWDSANGAWREITTSYSGGLAPLPSPSIYSSKYTFDTVHRSYFIHGRAISETHTGKPSISREFPLPNQRPDSETFGTTDTLTLNYGYEGGLLKSVRVSGKSNGQNLKMSNQVGVDYNHDNFGYIKEIIPLRGVGEPLLKTIQTHNMFGWPLTKTDANGLTTTYEWDASHKLRRISPPIGLEKTEINPSQDLKSTAVTRGASTTTYHYNGFGQIVQVDPAGKESKYYKYHKSGQIKSESVFGSESKVTEFTYDSRNRLETVVDPNGVNTTYGYDNAKNVKTITTTHEQVDSNNQVQKIKVKTELTYDAKGRLRNITDAKGYATSYEYDAGDRLLSVTAGTQLRKWVYNDLGWLKKIEQPESGTTLFEDFCVQGTPLLVTNGSTKRVSTVDTLGRLLTLKGSTATSASSIDQVFEYDAKDGWGSHGKLRASTDGPIRQLYKYNDLGLLSLLQTEVHSGTDATSSNPESYAQGFEYDTYGNRSVNTMQYQGEVEKYTTTWNNVLGLPEKICNSTGTTFADVSWAPDSGNPSEIKYLNKMASATIAYRPDQVLMGKLTYRFGASVLKSWTYEYDDANRLRTDGEDSYTYDELNRLKTSKNRSEFGSNAEWLQQTYDYDRHGNMVSRIVTGMTHLPGGVNPFQYTTTEVAAMAATNQLPTTATGARYDGQGNLTEVRLASSANGALVTMDYDALGRVIALACDANKTYERYAYNAEGLRIRIQTLDSNPFKTASPKTTAVTHHIYNDQRQMAAEFKAAF